MMANPLLSDESTEHSLSINSSTALEPNESSDPSHGLDTGHTKPMLVIPAYRYYGLLTCLLITTVVAVVIAVSWAAATPVLQMVYVPVVAPSSSTGGLSPISPSSSSGPSIPISISSSSYVLPTVSDVPNALLPRFPSYPSYTWPGQIKPQNLLYHLSGIYSIAMNNDGSRDIIGRGFNSTIDYLMGTIARETNLVNVERTHFTYTNPRSTINPYFSATIRGLNEPLNFTFAIDFIVARNSHPSDGIPATLILVSVSQTRACTQEEFDTAVGSNPPKHFWLIVPLSNFCLPITSVPFAQYVNASGIIIAGGERNGVLSPYFLLNTTGIPAISMSNSSSSRLIAALEHGGSSAVNISCGFGISDISATVSNVCGETPVGDPTSVVVVGGHSDTVAGSPGINDNGSGAVSTLVLAIALTRLMSDPKIKYKPVNMVKFCWFGAEEQGILGSSEAVRIAVEKNTDPHARIGSRAKDWVVMVNLDMLGSMNFQNWVYDVSPSVPQKVWQGAKALSSLFTEYFTANNLPSDTLKGYSSDANAFITAGIPAGGVTSGGGVFPFLKTEAQRARYQRMTGWGGVAGAFADPCQHRACDSIENIHWGVYTNQTQAVAYVLERLVLKTNLRRLM